MPFRPIYSHLSFFVFVLFVALAGSTGRAQTKIACIGDSITFGATIQNREQNCYPTQLSELLGPDFQVRNFGVNGATLLQKGDRPYVKQHAYKQALDFKPQIVLIKLGTNDTKPHNWSHKANFVADYLQLIQSFRELEPTPRIVLLLPVPAFSDQHISSRALATEVLPKIREVAYSQQCELVSLHEMFLDHPEEFPDKIHPNRQGASRIAHRLATYLTRSTDKTYRIKTELELPEQSTNFYGFPMTDFKYQGRACKIVEPKQVAAGRPWIWRARFWAHEPQVDLALLEAGFHLVYCDVAGLFGSPQAVKIWDQFYAHMQEAKLHPKVALEGLSRGGLIIYNWSASNPQHVACIYADAPVCDLKSWPAGKLTGRGNSREWPLCQKAYGLTEQEMLAWDKNPIDNLKPIAAAKIPLLHVCGEADLDVPVVENTAVLEARYKELGGPIQVILKPGVAHHPHSLKNPTPIVDFILKHTNQQ